MNIKRYLPFLLLGVIIFSYILYFSSFTITRYQKLWASYFDLGIMHQTVYNTYEGLKTADYSRILEMTDPHFSGKQVKRMSVHNDIILALLSPFYFIATTPATLLVIQTIVVAFGADAVFRITQIVFAEKKYRDWIALVFSFSYLMYPAMQRATIFDFHAVVLATAFLLYMFYFWLTKKYGWSILFLLLSLITKEQVGMTTMFFGAFVYFTTYYEQWREKSKRFSIKGFLRSFTPRNDVVTRYALFVMGISLVWFILSFAVIIPAFRGSEHFATEYYGDHGDSPLKVLLSLLSNPVALVGILFKVDSLRYLLNLFGPLGFLSLLSPLHLLIAAPEFGVNLISNSWAMKQIIYHYTSVIQPFIFISAIYGARKILDSASKLKMNVNILSFSLIAFLLLTTSLFSYLKSPLPYSKEADMYPFRPLLAEHDDAMMWKEKLRDPGIKVSATGHLAPHFTSRRYFYDLSPQYIKADYVVIQKREVYNNFQKDITIPAYEKLIIDPLFEKIYDMDGLEVYKKLPITND